MRRDALLLSLSGFVLGAVPAVAQLPAPQPKPLFGARSLALSPDGSRLAFSYHGDIWVAPIGGGKAMPVTNHVEMEDNPVWSPCGNWIAFSSNRTGNNDIFVVPADGGQSRRLTWHSGSDVPTGWSPDGKHIAFRATRDDSHNGLYAVDVLSGQTRRLMLDMMSVGSPSYASDGKRLAYSRFGFPFTRPRYEGSLAAQLWTVNLDTGRRERIRANGFQHLWPSFAPDGKTMYAVTVSEKTPSSSNLDKPIAKIVDTANRTPNVYAIEMNGRGRRLTDFIGGSVRFLTVASKAGTLAFEQEGRVYTMQAGGKPQQVQIIATLDDKTTQEERLVLTTGASAQDLSPNGEQIAFSVRGELWLVPVKKGRGPNRDDAVQLTSWAGKDEDPLWHPDGKSVFFVSDREGSDRIYRLEVETLKTTPVTVKPHDALGLQFTPDRKRLSFWVAGSQGGLYTVPVDGGEPTRVLARPGNYQFGPETAYSWSPDGRYVAYTDTLLRSGYYHWQSATNILIHDTKENRTVNVTRLSAEHIQPQFSPDGRYLFFRSNRSGPGIYALPLRREDARETELEMKYEKPGDTVTVEIDWDDIATRPRRIISQAPQGNIRVDRTNGEVYFLSEGDIWKAAYSGEEVRRLTTGGGIASFEFGVDGNRLSFVRGGNLNLMEIRKPNNPIEAVGFRADWTRDLREERRAAFHEFWRANNRSFYDGNFHGRDWATIMRRYEPFLESVGHRNEMATVLNMMVGELEASHTEVSPAPANLPSTTSPHLGFTVDYSHPGPGIKVLEVPRRSPGSFPKTEIKPGEFVVAINGRDVRWDEALWRDVLNNQGGRDVTLLVNSRPNREGAREVKYRILGSGDWSAIIYRNRIEDRRRYVEEKSGGRLTYVHISGMGDGNFDTFNQEVWAYSQDRKGLIIDVRNNGGGNISDRVIDILERAPHSWYQPRDGSALLAPGQALNLPMVVMHAETSLSNAEMFPYAMKQRGLATLVGMPTPGYVIWTYGLRLVDGTSARMPSTGVYRLDGTPLENLGQRPDILIDITAEEYFSGKDPQLDRAIDVLMSKTR
jgi:tricorn protease